MIKVGKVNRRVIQRQWVRGISCSDVFGTRRRRTGPGEEKTGAPNLSCLIDRRAFDSSSPAYRPNLRIRQFPTRQIFAPPTRGRRSKMTEISLLAEFWDIRSHGFLAILSLSFFFSSRNEIRSLWNYCDVETNACLNIDKIIILRNETRLKNFLASCIILL